MAEILSSNNQIATWGNSPILMNVSLNAETRLRRDGRTVAWFDSSDTSTIAKDTNNLAYYWHNKLYYVGTGNFANNVFSQYSSNSMVITAGSDPVYGAYSNIADDVDVQPRFLTSNQITPTGYRFRVQIRARKATAGTTVIGTYDSNLGVYNMFATLTANWAIYTFDTTSYGNAILMLHTRFEAIDIQVLSIYNISGISLNQGTLASRPLWSTDGMLFDGSNDFMKTAAFTFNQPEMIYIVFKQVTWTQNDDIFDGATWGYGELYQYGSPNGLKIWGGSASPENKGLALNTFGIVRVLFNGTSSKLQVNQNAATIGDFGANNMGGFTLGVRGSSVTSFSNIQVKEIILRNVVEVDSFEQQIYDYLKIKYGL